MKAGAAVTAIAVMCLLFSVYLALLSLENLVFFLDIKLDAPSRMHLLFLATFLFATAMILLACIVFSYIIRKASLKA